jgi:hypothetical protein
MQYNTVTVFIGHIKIQEYPFAISINSLVEDVVALSAI